MKFMFDNNLSEDLAEAMDALCRKECLVDQVLHIKEMFPGNMDDIAWMNDLRHHGGRWVVVTHDKLKKQAGAERAAFRENEMIGYVLDPQWNHHGFWPIARCLRQRQRCLRLQGQRLMPLDLNLDLRLDRRSSALSAAGMRMAVAIAPAAVVVAAVAVFPATGLAAESRCFGTVALGSITDSVRLPMSGANFSAYSTMAAGIGRTHVHSTVARIVADSYRAMEASLPGTVFVYGETGLSEGGRFKPHRTHQNGTSVDFFVPVRDAKDRSVPLPTPITQRFGYDIDFDANARHGEYRIDFEAIGEHLYQLDAASQAAGTGITQVIFDRAYLPRLFATKRGPWIEQHIRFMRATPWVRHDEHYHVDFAVRCEPIGTGKSA